MKPSGIGGQAVIEGVMMKNNSEYAIAIRKPDNTIGVKKEVYISLGDRISILRLPVLRGVASFLDSLALGMNSLSYSASFYEEDDVKEDGGDKDKKAKNDKKTKNENKAKSENKAGNEKKDNVIMTLTMTLSIIIAVAVFVLLPFYIMEAAKKQITSYVARSVIEGLIRLLLFIIYVKAITAMKDIKRVYMYHGAEHKVINCVESGRELTIENARRQSKEHKRCGTSFLLYVVVLSIIFFAFINVEQIWLRMLLRIILVPVVAGVAYEFIRLAGRTNNVIVNILSIPGLWMQRLTTTEPDDDMLEVAIASVEAVFDWRGYQTGSIRMNMLRVPYDNDSSGESGALDGTDKTYNENRVVDSVGESSFEDVSFSDDDEEEDEVLKALDRFFMMDDDESLKSGK